MMQARGGEKIWFVVGLLLSILISFGFGYLLGIRSAFPRNVPSPTVEVTPSTPIPILSKSLPAPADPTQTLALSTPSVAPLSSSHLVATQSQSASAELEAVDCKSGCLASKPGCKIKGNISFSSQQKIYHLPGGKFYSETVINPDIGERWFCTEAEALQNGWRKSQE